MQNLKVCFDHPDNLLLHCSECTLPAAPVGSSERSVLPDHDRFGLAAAIWVDWGSTYVPKTLCRVAARQL